MLGCITYIQMEGNSTVKTVKKDSSQLCLLVHAFACYIIAQEVCIISTSTSLCLGV